MGESKAALFHPSDLDERESEVLDRIEELKRQFALGFGPNRWDGLLRRNAFAKAVQASNSIEGYEISTDDAVAAVEGEEPIDEKTENWLANVGYCRAMTMVLQKAGAPLLAVEPKRKTLEDLFIESVHKGEKS